MQNPVFHRSLVNSAQLWVTDIKCGILGMLIIFAFQFLVESEQIIFQVEFKLLHIELVCFTSLEFVPR